MKPIHRKIKQLQIRVVNRLLSQAINFRGQHQKSKRYYDKETISDIRSLHPFDYGHTPYRAVQECKEKKDSFKHQLFWTYKNHYNYRIDAHTLQGWYGNYYCWKKHCFDFLMSLKGPKKIRGTDENWDNGTLGTDERYVVVAPPETQELVIDRNCINCKWNINNVCENSDWKDGKAIADPTVPQCGYLGNKNRPIGWVYSS